MVHTSDLKVSLGGAAMEPWRIKYAGLTPGSAGLYQINLLLPDNPGTDPEIRVTAGDQTAAAGHLEEFAIRRQAGIHRARAVLECRRTNERQRAVAADRRAELLVSCGSRMNHQAFRVANVRQVRKQL